MFCLERKIYLVGCKLQLHTKKATTAQAHFVFLISTARSPGAPNSLTIFPLLLLRLESTLLLTDDEVIMPSHVQLQLYFFFALGWI